MNESIKGAPMILAGDIGGTKVRLALYTLEKETFIQHQTETYLTRDFPNLEEVVKTFLDRYTVPVNKGCLGVPGPVIKGQARATNLPWPLSEEHISQQLGIPVVKLVNDHEATAAAIPYFSPEQLLTLHPGELNGPTTTFAVLAPGTGLGQAYLIHTAGKSLFLASEGGHTDFAPNSPLEWELRQFLQSRFEHVSYERVLSGPGLVNIYEFLKSSGYAVEPPELKKRLQEGDPAAVISQAGQAGEYQICVKSLDIFASILGAQAGNLVLNLLATGGIYLGGGIPLKIRRELQNGTVVSAYLKKGRLSYLVEKTPLRVILDPQAALLGAASIAAKL